MAGSDKRRPRAMGAVALGVAVTAIHLMMSAFMRAPTVMPDEGGYLDSARFLALGGPRPITNFYPGLSVLITPLWRFSHDPLTVWRATMWVNGVAAGLSAALAWALVPCLSPRPLSTGWRLAVSLVVSAYPALLLYSNTAMSESLFAAAAAALIGLAWLAARRTQLGAGAGAWFGLGAGAGLLVSIHPRGAAIAVAVLIVGALVLRPWSASGGRPPAVALAAGMTLGAALTRVALVGVRPASGTGQSAYQAGVLIDRVAPHSVSGVMVGGASQILYLSVATAGLAPLGVILGLLDLRRLAIGRAPSPAMVARGLAGLSSAGVLAMSALFLNSGATPGQLIVNGRYNEGAILAPLVIAIVWLVGSPRGTQRTRRCLGWLVTGGMGLLIGAAGLAWGVDIDHLQAPVNPVSVLALEPLIRRVGSIDPLTLAAAGAIVLGGAVLLMIGSPRVALAALTVLFAAASLDTFAEYLVPGSTAKARQDVLASTIAEATGRLHVPRSCIGYDAGIDFTFFNDRFLLPGWQLVPFDGSSGAAPCGSLAISSRPDFFAHYPGAQIVSEENDVVQILYVVPGSAETRLAASGWLLPAALPGPLPSARQAAVVSAKAVPTTVHEGRSTVVRVNARNTGTGSAWPNLRGLKTDRFVVRVAVRWFPSNVKPTLPGATGDEPAATSFVELPRTLLPGQVAHLDLLLAPKTAGGTNLRPGHYVVQVVVYQELVGALPGKPLMFPVIVRP